ncbi:hypothetical protein [Polaribacter cellanae]|uniref:Uncharacterized protein n=1 Tax=Polaribacter cellanae TaxID=2818493 RepID=A0A975H9E7_9FLAO|nr:hypothetical protein [Polaribacter cellanae]QTE22800.1 hypothetical protein J3359_00535 [Polaribacter cellanae]
MDFGIFGLASICLVYFFLEIVFKNVWSNKIEINDLITIEIDNDVNEDNIDEDSKIEITFKKNNGREKIIKLRKDKNQLESFLEEIQRRNARIKIEYI